VLPEKKLKQWVMERNKMNIPFQLIDWNKISKEEHKGATGNSFWQTLQYDGLRVRIVEYSAGYLADHWCKKGHIVHCLEGEVLNELENGDKHLLKTGMTYIVSDEMSSHRSVAKEKVKLLIIDGDFLK
jgi:quercetin dioxygenase-like cupin family protein